MRWVKEGAPRVDHLLPWFANLHRRIPQGAFKSRCIYISSPCQLNQNVRRRGQTSVFKEAQEIPKYSKVWEPLAYFKDWSKERTVLSPH